MKAAHHRGGHQVNAKRVTAVANANPLTLCWRCRRTIWQHAPHSSGEPAKWTGGHTQPGGLDAQPWLDPLIVPAHCEKAARGNYLAPEASTCNFSGGATSVPTEQIITTRRW